MKKLIFYIILQFLALSVKSQSYNAIVINENGDKKATIVTNEIDSITFDNSNRQLVWLKDSIYKTALSTLTSTSFEKIELPEVLVANEGLGEWSEMRIHKDGSLIALKKRVGQDIPTEGCVIMPNETLGVLYCTFKIDENEVPQYITINDCVITVDNYTDNYVGITVAYNDTIAYSLDSIPFNRNMTRSWAENNWQRNLTGILELASGAAGVVGGALLITGSVISEAGSFGASTPVSIPGILAGSATIAGGVSSISSGWEKLFTPGASKSNIGETIYYQTAGELIGNGPQNAYVPEQYFAYMKDPNYSKQLGKVGWINFFVGLTTGVVDNLYGRTVTWEDIRQYYQGKVITGLSKDIATNSATLRGYISPDITKSLLNGTKIENEYGVVLYSTKDETERRIRKETNGDGGMIEYDFNDLKPGTTYNYRAYYIDKTNGISLLGEIKTFKTLELKAYVSSFKVINSQYSVGLGAYYNDGRSYNYKFDASTTVEIESLDGVADWGYVYKDPYGNIKRISLIQYGTSYTDTRYAYYRNEAKSTACLYGYVKYKSDDEYYDNEPQYYPLEYSINTCPDGNHPHAIDLGLPSGTKWCCCNVGASSPEEYGGYYAWGETSEKDIYSRDTYAHYNYVADRYENIGSDISCTQYDVAHVHMGTPWRMPSHEQQMELIELCTMVWAQQNGVDGILVTGLNGGQVFFPAAGYRHNEQLDNADSEGYYWSSSLCPGNLGRRAHALWFTSGNYWTVDHYDYSGDGYSVRAVCP